MKKILYFLCFFVMCSNASTQVALTSNYVDKEATSKTSECWKYTIKSYQKSSEDERNQCATEIWQRIAAVDAACQGILITNLSARKEEIIKAISPLLKKWTRGYVTIGACFKTDPDMKLSLKEKFAGDKLILASSRDGNGTPIEIGIKIHGAHKLNTSTADDGIEITFLRKF